MSFSGPAVIASFVFQVLFKDKDAGWVRDFIFLILIKGVRRWGEFVIVLIASAKSRSARPTGSSHHPAFMGSCLTISHACLPCLPNRWVSPCVPCVIEGSKNAGLVWTKGEPSGISYWAELHLESCQTSTMELHRENSRRPQQVDYICKKGPTTDVWLDFKCTPSWRCCKCGVQVEWSAWNL